MTSPDIGLDTLLDLDGSILEQEGGYWIKIEVRRIPTSDLAQHGIRYSLTLHDKYGTRILGYDNAHAVKPPKKFKSAGQRLWQSSQLLTALKDEGLHPAQYHEYLDLRRYGHQRTSGMGLGFGRLLTWLLGANSIRDVTTFPRFPGHITP